MVQDIFVIGIPASITNLMQSFMVMMTNHFLFQYGTGKIAAMGIALKVNMITAMILVGFAFGGQPLIGYNYGAKNGKRLKEVLKFAYLLEMGLGLVFAVGMSIFAPVIIKVFMAVTLVSTCVCQAFGNAVGAFVLSISRQGIVYVVALFALSKAFGYLGVLISQACADVVTAIIAVTIIWKLMKDFDQ